MGGGGGGWSPKGVLKGEGWGGGECKQKVCAAVKKLRLVVRNVICCGMKLSYTSEQLQRVRTWCQEWDLQWREIVSHLWKTGQKLGHTVKWEILVMAWNCFTPLKNRSRVRTHSQEWDFQCHEIVSHLWNTAVKRLGHVIRNEICGDVKHLWNTAAKELGHVVRDEIFNGMKSSQTSENPAWDIKQYSQSFMVYHNLTIHTSMELDLKPLKSCLVHYMFHNTIKYIYIFHTHMESLILDLRNPFYDIILVTLLSKTYFIQHIIPK